MTYHRDMFSEHLLLHPMSAPMTLRWLSDRFAGTPLREHIGADQVADAAESRRPTAGMSRLGVISAKVVTGRRWNVGRCELSTSRQHRVTSTGGQPPRSSRAVDTATSA